jgi:hypothetical protein
MGNEIIAVQGNRRVVILTKTGAIEKVLYETRSDIMAFGVTRNSNVVKIATADYYGEVKCWSLTE